MPNVSTDGCAFNIVLQTMKLDVESPYDYICPTNEHASKVIDHSESYFVVPNDNNFLIDLLKIENEAIKQDKYDIAAPIERKILEDTDPSQCRNCPVPHSYVNMGDSINGNNNKRQCMEALNSVASAQIGLVEKEDDYTDKTVTEVELPEMIVCVKDGASHIVKDVCIDERVNSTEKDLMDNDEVEQKISFSYDQSPQHQNNGLTEEMTGTAFSHDFKYTLANGDPLVVQKDPADVVFVVDKDSEERHSSESSVTGEGKLETTESSMTGGDKLDTTELVASNISAQKVTGKQLLPLQKSNPDSRKDNSSILDCSIDQKQSIDGQKTDQGTLEEVNSQASAMSFAAEEGDKEDIASGKVQSGVIAFHFESGAASISGREAKKETVDSQQSGQAQNGPGTEDETLDRATASARCSFVHLRGDSNFSGPCLSGPVASSGHIPYSGSISLRSDSSTTSVRSFAFPILQSEWNNSPVKMAKADRRKHRGWKMGLLCCKF